MRKVGIMSMQRIANYGSFLQAYALKQLIEEVGCNVEFVDYHVGAPVIAENADSKNKVVRKIEKGLETFRYRAPLAHKLSFIRYKQSFARKYIATQRSNSVCQREKRYFLQELPARLQVCMLFWVAIQKIYIQLT